MTYFLKVKSLAVAQLPLSRHSSSRLGSALNLRQFRSAVRWADYLALDSLVTLTSSNLAALRFLVKLSLLDNKRMAEITGKVLWPMIIQDSRRKRRERRPWINRTSGGR